MVINHSSRWLYLGPPKTGTTTMVRFLTDPKLGFGGEYTGWQHDMDAPPGCEDYFVFATIRNPFARAVSLWWHRLHELRKQETPGQSRREVQMLPLRSNDLAFGDYVDWIAGGDAPDFYAFTLSRWFKWVPRIDAYLRTECLAEDFRKLGLGGTPTSLPRLNKTAHRPWPQYYTAELVTKVAEWARPDLERFGDFLCCSENLLCSASST